MSHKRYRQPLDLKPRFSRRLFVILLAVHLLAAVALFLPSTLPWYGRAIILLVIVFSVWSTLYKAHFQTIKSACWKMRGDFELELINGNDVQARLLAGGLVTEWLIVLHLACVDGRKHKWMILPDMIEHETYRRLCVRLRQWHADVGV
ncbi:MAG TPA: hypothetical protein ENI98_14820 [Gammaproteobacteria bacterium]|nr:hypothetical protein [Gammaproteobacteria bacterium]